MPPRLRRALDGAGVLDVHRQRLLHHHVNVARGAGFDHHGMVVGVGERRHRFGLDALQHSGQIGEEDRLGQAIALGVFALQCGIGIEDSGDDNVLALSCRAQEAVDVAVNQPGDAEPERVCGEPYRQFAPPIEAARARRQRSI